MNDIDYESLPYEKLIEFKKTYSQQSEDHKRSEIELYRRRRERDKENAATRRSIKRMTTIILFLTAFTALNFCFNLLQFCSK